MNRILHLTNQNEIITEMKKVGVSSQGIRAMSDKAFGLVIKLKHVKTGAANIIKQDMLSLGGDAAVARGVVNGQIERSDVIILGNENNIKKLLNKLSHQNIFEIPELRKDIQQLLYLRNKQQEKFINARGYQLNLNRTLIMGIVNISPDSFYDGGKHNRKDEAILHIEKMIENGADIIDIGGESTRPFATKISVAEELERIMPIIEESLKKFDIPLSVDTYKSEVAKKALQTGVHIINDISGLNFDKKMASTIAQYSDVPVVVMHIQGTPQNMQKNPKYNDVIEDIIDFLSRSIQIGENAGINQNNFIIDPGIGFGKTVLHNMEIIKRISEFKCLGKPILLGCSNKSFIGKILKSEKSERLEGTLAVNSYGIMNGVNILRVHEVRENKKMAQMIDALRKT
ncbi:MAG: dihydropteroate synthase [Candidatus Cloacimonadota bacterium]|nr:dihydropteroate synthase [Candidatus Cloacimonadota bacterium]